MRLLHAKYAPHVLWLVTLIGLFIAVIFVTKSGLSAAAYVNGVTVNLFDPVIWLIAALPGVFVRRNVLLFISLVTLSTLTIFLRLYMQTSTGSHWITGSILGNFAGLVTVGYVINAIIVVRRSRKARAIGSGA